MRYILRAVNESDSTLFPSELMKEMLLGVFVNPDGGSMFGTPWEIFPHHGYLVISQNLIFDYLPSQIGTKQGWSTDWILHVLFRSS